MCLFIVKCKKNIIFIDNKKSDKIDFRKIVHLCSYLLFGKTGVNKRGMNKEASKNHSICYFLAMHIHCNRKDTGVPIKFHQQNVWEDTSRI